MTLPDFGSHGMAQPLTIILFHSLFFSVATFRLKPIKAVTMTISDSEAFMQGLLKATFRLKMVKMTDPNTDAFMQGFLAGTVSSKIKACISSPIDATGIMYGVNAIEAGSLNAGLEEIVG